MRCPALALLTGASLLITPAPAAKTHPATLPPYAGAYQPQGVDERGLWMMADEDERALRDSKFVLRDPALQAYVRRVLCDTVGAERCAGVRIYIVRVPAMNASMTPNGTLEIWTGLLLRVRSEAELGGVLAHEFAHFEQRHSLAAYRQRRTMSDIVAWAGMLGTSDALIGATAVGSVFSFSREQEKEADVRAFGYLTASHYRAGAEADIWDRAMDEADATTTGRRQRSQRYNKSFFATHPSSLERSTYLHTLAAQAGNEGDDAIDSYRATLAKWRPEFLADQLKLNDFAGTEYLLGQLASDGWTADLLFARGELYRLRGNPRDLVNATVFYRDAIAKGASDPVIHRCLGMALLRSNYGEEGRAELARYLAMKPDAEDAAMVAMLADPTATN